MTPGDIAQGRRWADRWWAYSLGGWTVAGACCGGLIALAVYPELVTAYATVGAFIGFWCAAAASELERRFVRRISPRFARYEEFQEALKSFEQARQEAEQRELRQRSEFWWSLPGHAFERELALLFERVGYEVTRTPGSGDGGIDLILRREGRTIAVQCKQTKKPVGPGAARDLYGALVHCQAEEGILATTAGATSGVYEFFKGKPLRVMGLTEILALQVAITRDKKRDTPE